MSIPFKEIQSAIDMRALCRFDVNVHDPKEPEPSTAGLDEYTAMDWGNPFASTEPGEVLRV